MSLDVPGVMRGIAAAVALTGLQAHAFPVDQVSPPAAVVAFPEGEIEYDSTMGRGTDRAVFLVYAVVGRVSDRSAFEALAGYMSGTGGSSLKAAIEADPALGGAAPGGTLQVVSSRVEPVVIGDVTYVAAVFSVDVLA